MWTKRIVKGIAIVLGLFLLFYFAYQAYRILYPQYVTATALIENISDSVVCQGVVVRDETVIDEWGGSARNYLVGDGAKVAVGEPVATVYSGGAQGAIDAMRYAALTEELAVVQASAESSRSSATSIANLSGGIYRCLTDISTAVSSGDFGAVHEQKLALLQLMNSYDLAVDETTDFSDRIEGLSALVNSISGGEAGQQLTAPLEGYFISYTDGLEASVNRQSLLSLPVESIAALAGSNPGKDTSRCKIVSGYVWDFAAVVDASMIERFGVGKSVSLDFPYAGVYDIPAEVSAVISEPDGSQAVVVLTCNRMNAQLAALRCERATIRFFDYEGIRVPRTALRVEDGVVGVYVKYGSSVVFKTLSIVYETDDYVVSLPGTAGGDQLARYDEVILQGKNLYVGKEL